MRKTGFRLLILVIFFSGAALLLTPHFQSLRSKFSSRKEVEEIKSKKQNNREPEESTEREYIQLYEDMKAYNEKIFRDGQSGLTDAWNFQQPVFRLSDYDTSGDAVGYLFIEAMDLELPLYLGASDENLDKGAAVLGQTSMPIGGTNSNCVIAAHRGWKGIPMFRDIELLQPGDKVILTNLWETLEYQVVKCIVITPDDIDAVKIMAGEDMLTLITCHPYTYNFQRYVVYCSRNGQISAEELPREGVTYVSSQKEIEREQKWNFAGLTVLGGGCMLGIRRFILGKRKKKNS